METVRKEVTGSEAHSRPAVLFSFWQFCVLSPCIKCAKIGMLKAGNKKAYYGLQKQFGLDKTAKKEYN